MGFTAPKVKGSIPFGRGDAFGHLPVGSDGNILVADSSGPSGVNWSSSAIAVAAGAGLSGFWIYGDGSDGDVTLVGNTTLAAGDSIKNYNNLTLAGFDLTFDSTDFYGVVYVKDTLSGGGGDLVAENRGSGTTNAGGAGGTSPSEDGGAGAAAFYVFARNITTVVEVTASGQGGTAGGGASIFLLPGANSEYASDIIFKLKSYPSPPTPPNPQGGFHFGPGVGFGGDGSGAKVTAVNRLEIVRTATDFLRMVVMNGFSSYAVTLPGPDERVARSNGGGGGAAGFGPNIGPATFVTAGGGGGGGGAGIIGDGGDGGGAAAVDQILEEDESSTSGAGGGAGGGGGLVILVADTITAATFLSAAGGIGGAGSAGGGGGMPIAPGGGGGGGGGGGYALAIVRSGAGFVSANVVGGAAGLGGGGGTPGAMGGTGFPGYAAVLVSA
jgi:hypothetical protein